MRRMTLSICVLFVLFTTLHVLSDEGSSARFNADAPYPAEVSLIEESPHGWTYRESTSQLPLYVSDKDGPGKSACNAGCDNLWIPLLARATAKPLGEWTIFRRNDGREQWSFRNRAVYTRINDSAAFPTGDGIDGTWHLMPHFK
jgi:predicted lipoprotein with Yx(FWY)xxD motif